MRIRLYGRLADAIGPNVEVDAALACSVAEIRDVLADSYPQAAGVLARSRACVGERLVGGEQLIDESDGLEFLPPVSGG